MIVFKNKGNYEGNVLISETRGGAVRHQEVRDSEGWTDGLALAWLWLRFMRGSGLTREILTF